MVTSPLPVSASTSPSMSEKSTLPLPVSPSTEPRMCRADTGPLLMSSTRSPAIPSASIAPAPSRTSAVRPRGTRIVTSAHISRPLPRPATVILFPLSPLMTLPSQLPGPVSPSSQVRVDLPRPSAG